MIPPEGEGIVERSCRVSLFLGKAHLNSEFRKRLQKDFEGAAKEFHLTQREIDALKTANWSEADDLRFFSGDHIGGLAVHHMTWNNVKDVKRLPSNVYGITVCV